MYIVIADSRCPWCFSSTDLFQADNLWVVELRAITTWLPLLGKDPTVEPFHWASAT